MFWAYVNGIYRHLLSQFTLGAERFLDQTQLGLKHSGCFDGLRLQSPDGFTSKLLIQTSWHPHEAALKAKPPAFCLMVVQPNAYGMHFRTGALWVIPWSNVYQIGSKIYLNKSYSGPKKQRLWIGFPVASIGTAPIGLEGMLAACFCMREFHPSNPLDPWQAWRK